MTVKQFVQEVEKMDEQTKLRFFNELVKELKNKDVEELSE